MLCHLPGRLPSTPDGGGNTDVSTPEEGEDAAWTRGGKGPEVSPLWPLMREDEVIVEVDCLPLREREPQRRLPLFAPAFQAARDCTDASYLCTSTGPADQSSRAWMLTVGLLGPSAGLLPTEGTDVM